MTEVRDDIAPETVNTEQYDAPAQAQSVAAEALARSAAATGLSESEKVPGGLDPAQTHDLVDHMRQMVTSGVIDMSAYNGEETMDDLENRFGPAGVADESMAGDDS